MPTAWGLMSSSSHVEAGAMIAHLETETQFCVFVLILKHTEPRAKHEMLVDWGDGENVESRQRGMSAHGFDEIAPVVGR